MTSLTPERIAALRQRVLEASQRPPETHWIAYAVITELLDHVEAQGRQLLTYRMTLTGIRTCTVGRVCHEFETCRHASCAASYRAWALADAALREAVPDA